MNGSNNIIALSFACQVAPWIWEYMLRLFGDKLRYLRRQHKLTQIELAQKMAPITQGHISLLEAGHRTPSLSLVLQVSTIFKIATEYLLRDEIASEMVSVYDTAQLSGQSAAPHLFGAKLRYLRQQHGMTQTQLAQQLPSWTQSHISFLEVERSEPSLELVLALAKLFAVTTDYLLHDSFPIEKPVAASYSNGVE